MYNLNRCREVVDEYLERCKVSYGMGLYGTLIRDKEELFQDTRDSFGRKEHNLGKIIAALIICEEHLFEYFERRAADRWKMWDWLSQEEEQELRAGINEDIGRTSVLFSD